MLVRESGVVVDETCGHGEVPRDVLGVVLAQGLEFVAGGAGEIPRRDLLGDRRPALPLVLGRTRDTRIVPVEAARGSRTRPPISGRTTIAAAETALFAVTTRTIGATASEGPVAIPTCRPVTVTLRTRVTVPTERPVAVPDRAVSLTAERTVAIPLRTRIAVPTERPVTVPLRTRVTIPTERPVTVPDRAVSLTAERTVAIPLRTRVTIPTERPVAIPLRTRATAVGGTGGPAHGERTVAIPLRTRIALPAERAVTVTAHRTITIPLRTRIALPAEWTIAVASGPRRLTAVRAVVVAAGGTLVPRRRFTPLRRAIAAGVAVARTPLVACAIVRVAR